MLFLFTIALCAGAARLAPPPGLFDAIRADSTQLSRYKRGALAARRREVLAALAAANRAHVLVECEGDLLGRGGRVVRQPTPEAKFLTALLSEDGTWRRRAFLRLCLLTDDLVDPIRQPLYDALLALIEAELRSPAIGWFLRKQNRWPARFVDGLRRFAVEAGPSERAYVVELLRTTGKLNRDWLKAKFYLGADVEADLRRIITSDGRSLCGE